MWAARKVRRLLYEFYGYYAIFIGVTSYRYDYKQQVYKSYSWMQWLASLANLLLLILLPLDLYYNCTQASKLDFVTILTYRLDSIVNDVICILRLLQRFARDKTNREFSQQLKRLQRIYRYRYRYQETDDDAQMERIYLLKNILIWVLLVFMMCIMLITFEELRGELQSPVLGRVLVVLYVLFMDGLDITIHMHFMLTWRICRLYLHMSRRIRELLVQPNDATVTLELHHLRWQHWQLTQLAQRLNVAYNFTLISSRFCLIVTATALGYYLSVFRAQKYSLFHQIVALTLYGVIGLDTYILDLIYDMTKVCQRQITDQLLQLNELGHVEQQLSKVCELFALQIACFPIEIKPYGLFVSGKATWLMNLVCIFSWMAVLLQYRLVSERFKLQV